MRRRVVALVVVLALGFTGGCAGARVDDVAERAGTGVESGAAPSAPSGSASSSVEPVPTGCPESGLRVTAPAEANAAMGYRELPLYVTNCGDKPVKVEGRPEIVVLDKERRPAGTSIVPSVRHAGEPRTLTLAPGQKAVSVLAWRNTVTSVTDPTVEGHYLSVAPNAGGARQLVQLPHRLDLGTTGRLEASVWQ
ncbi:hypothetical protein Val02_06690 [Virgisporangium aliadipatigenens]|uniref:DUF4232 domain-containing protein n=1 Tax=Virgisporangium aliadipatigenens TaxID=741659 RepID=A0A8J4DNP1_9ACTN|nr:DUF4232 domain-containing protein [Virgisporangium aliadipatigenens]GIJ43783.1 hypothetical protein Val02_06690 [Virgisporangium aliadipatigenens]